MLEAELLKLLVCPETKQKLRLGDAVELERLNARISGRKLRNRAGREVSEEIEAILIRSDNKVGYLVRNTIPIMIQDESVVLEA